MRECGNAYATFRRSQKTAWATFTRKLPHCHLSLGGLGLRSAVRTSVPAHWASWADVLPMIRDRHPVVATTIVNALENDTAFLALGRRARQRKILTEWKSLRSRNGARTTTTINTFGSWRPVVRSLCTEEDRDGQWSGEARNGDHVPLDGRSVRVLGGK